MDGTLCWCLFSDSCAHATCRRDDHRSFHLPVHTAAELSTANIQLLFSASASNSHTALGIWQCHTPVGDQAALSSHDFLCFFNSFCLNQNHDFLLHRWGNSKNDGNVDQKKRVDLLQDQSLLHLVENLQAIDERESGG